MILEFSITNTFSIKETQNISFEAAISDQTDDIHIINYGGKKFLKMACIYGANAAGKTNIAQAFLFYMGFLLSSFIQLKPDENTHFTPFLFDDETINAPGKFNLIFYAQDFENSSNIVKYEYDISLNQKEVIYESLYYSPKGQKKLIFERTQKEIKWGAFVTGAKSIIADLTRPNCSLIGAGAQANHPIFTFIYKHFSNRIKPNVLPVSELISDELLEFIETDESFKNKVVEILKASDFGSISDIQIESHDVPDFILNMLPPEIKDEISKTGVPPKDRTAKIIHHYKKDYALPLTMESAGTKRMMELTLPLVQLSNSSVLVMDELEASLHQVLLEAFIQLYLESSTDSQLLFTTHNQDLLDSSLLRDDEVWFCYKDDLGGSFYNSISDFTGFRKEASRKKLYMAGKFGSLPTINMDKLREIFSAKKN